MAFCYTLLLVLQAILHIEGSAFKHQGYTPLKINEIACTAEKLKVCSNFKVKNTNMYQQGKISMNSNIMIIHLLEQWWAVYV